MALKFTISICVFAIFAILGIYFYKWANNKIGNAASWFAIFFWGIITFIGIGFIFYAAFYLIAVIINELAIP